MRPLIGTQIQLLARIHIRNSIIIFSVHMRVLLRHRKCCCSLNDLEDSEQSSSVLVLPISLAAV